MNLPKPTTILFDWDNTLVDTWPTIHAALNVLMRERGMEEWSLERTKGNVKRSMREAFPEMFGEDWQDAAKIYQGAYRAIHLDNLHGLPNVEAMLDHLKQSPLKTGVVSNKQGDTLRKESDHIGWNHYFDVLVGAGDAARDKPHTDPIEHALAAIDGSAGKDIWFIGDTIVDLEAANDAGCTSILYGDVETDDGSYLGHNFHAHARDHAALLTLIEAH